jgi:hypothetical protein
MAEWSARLEMTGETIMNVHETTEIRVLTVDELDKVTGGTETIRKAKKQLEVMKDAQKGGMLSKIQIPTLILCLSGEVDRERHRDPHACRDPRRRDEGTERRILRALP